MLAVVDPHADLVDAYLAAAEAIGPSITAVFEPHLQADHVSGLPALVERAGEELGPIGPLAEQAHLADFYVPQRGIFVIGRFFAKCVAGEVHAGASTTEVLR